MTLERSPLNWACLLWRVDIASWSVLGKGQSSVLVKVQDVFQGGVIRAVKVLHTHYVQLGVQESDCLRRINMADPYRLSATLRLCNTFSYHGHYCMTFESLCPEPITFFFQEMPMVQVIPAIRKVALRLLQAIGFLQQQNVIHADLKPANILLEKESDLSSVKVVDFGNAIHCIYEELSLYYDDFELQTLLYRAPEVVFGLPFGLEVDMWGLGCVLAELYLNRPLFRGSDKPETLTTMTDFLGFLPEEVFKRGKFFKELSKFTSRSSEMQLATTFELMDKLECDDYLFVDFLRLLLLYTPHERMTVSEAARHPFLAPELALGYIMPTSAAADQGYPSVPADHQNYTKRPYVDEQRKRKHLSSTDLLREGTSDTPPAAPKVAMVIPMVKVINCENNNNINNSGGESGRRSAFRNSLCVLQQCTPTRSTVIIEHPKARYPRSRVAVPSPANDQQVHSLNSAVHGNLTCAAGSDIHTHHYAGDRLAEPYHGQCCGHSCCRSCVKSHCHGKQQLDGFGKCLGSQECLAGRCCKAQGHKVQRLCSNAGVDHLSGSFACLQKKCPVSEVTQFESVGDSPSLSATAAMQPVLACQMRRMQSSFPTEQACRVPVIQNGCCKPAKPAVTSQVPTGSLSNTFLIHSFDEQDKNTKGIIDKEPQASFVGEPVNGATGKCTRRLLKKSKPVSLKVEPLVAKDVPTIVNKEMKCAKRPAVTSQEGKQMIRQRGKRKATAPSPALVVEFVEERCVVVKPARKTLVRKKVQQKPCSAGNGTMKGSEDIMPGKVSAEIKKRERKSSKPLSISVPQCSLTLEKSEKEEGEMLGNGHIEKKDSRELFANNTKPGRGPAVKIAKKLFLVDSSARTTVSSKRKLAIVNNAGSLHRRESKAKKPIGKRHGASVMKERQAIVPEGRKLTAMSGSSEEEEEEEDSSSSVDSIQPAVKQQRRRFKSALPNNRKSPQRSAKSQSPWHVHFNSASAVEPELANILPAASAEGKRLTMQHYKSLKRWRSSENVTPPNTSAGVTLSRKVPTTKVLNRHTPILVNSWDAQNLTPKETEAFDLSNEFDVSSDEVVLL